MYHNLIQATTKSFSNGQQRIPSKSNHPQLPFQSSAPTHANSRKKTNLSNTSLSGQPQNSLKPEWDPRARVRMPSGQIPAPMMTGPG